tara:strand:- start:57 stop:989 length:933 start_codon:yes stop_codon:yes gene_type:complete
MADIFEEKDEEELVVIETEDETFPVAQEEEPAEVEEEEEERLAMSEDDSEDEITSKQGGRDRRKRRELQKRARDNAKRELDFLRQQNTDLVNRVQAIEGKTYTQQAQTIEQRYQHALYEAQQAEQIMVRAIEAGNGADMLQAQNIRDQAKKRAEQLVYEHQQTQQQAQQATAPRADPRVVDYAKQWMDANQWYNPQGRDEDSAITKAIDNSLAAEGWNPASEDYWHELTRRVAARVNDDDDGQAQNRTPRRKAPPTGNTREHTPSRTRNEVVVTPERKAAMIEAGIWDDPVRRTSQLKAYQAYDRERSAR